MKVYEALVEAAIAEGCDTLFGLMGDGNMPFYAHFGIRPEVRVFASRHEAGAVGMADGFFRATGHLALASVTWGPGLMQTGTALTVAARNATPMVVVTGSQTKPSRDTHQTLDHRAFADLCGARFIEIVNQNSAAEQIAEAFYAARVHRTPVILDLPLAVGDKQLEWDWDYRPSTLVFRQDRLPGPTRDSLAAIADALAAAERPVIVAGRGAQQSDAREDILALADLCGALVGTSLLAKNWFAGERFDIGIVGAFASAPSEELLAEADFVLGIGAELGYFTTEGGLLFPSAQVARNDVKRAPSTIGLLPGLYATGDAREAARTLLTMLVERRTQKVGFRTQATRDCLERAAPSRPRPTDGLDPKLIMEELSRALPPRVRVSCGVGHYWGTVAMYLSLPRDAEFESVVQFGSIGQAIVQAIGGALGATDRPQVVIDGDGSFLMQLAEIETACRYRARLVVVIVNDSGYGAEIHKLRAKGFPDAASLVSWTSPDFVGLVRLLGGDGVLLRAENEIGDALRQGLAANTFFVIDARVSTSVLSETYRKLHFAERNEAPRLTLPASAS